MKKNTGEEINKIEQMINLDLDLQGNSLVEYAKQNPAFIHEYIRSAHIHIQLITLKIENANLALAKALSELLEEKSAEMEKTE